MARYTGPKCKLCRREGVKLYLKGSRCVSEKCAITRRNQPPGQRYRGRGRLSDYGKHLREKQKVKRMYGLLESQFRKNYDKAAKVKGVTGDLFLQMLESRLDNVVYIAGFTTARQSARQLIRQGKVKVNDKTVNIPSYRVSAGDFITVDRIEKSSKEKNSTPVWLKWSTKEKGISIERLPLREDIDAEINEQLIVEYYSR